MKTYIVLSLFFALGCGDDSQGLALDLAVADLATSRDLAVADLSGDPNAILGTFVGACGSVAAQLHVPSPSLIDNALVYVAGEAYVRSSFSTGGQTLFDTPNAGGSSTESELMSEEILHYCDGAHFLKSETEIAYAPPDVDAGGNIITDILVGFGADKVGVSVTRAYKPGGMSDQEVHDLIAKKLDGINHSSARVLPADKWVKQILHVFVDSQAASDAVGRVWPTLDAPTRADTIVLVTHTTGGGFIYCNPDPPLGSECP